MGHVDKALGGRGGKACTDQAVLMIRTDAELGLHPSDLFIEKQPENSDSAPTEKDPSPTSHGQTRLTLLRQPEPSRLMHMCKAQ